MKELLFSITKKDFEITFFNGTGNGGQYRNKHVNCVRIKHKETGLIATGQDQRSQKANLKNAFNRLVNGKKFQIWLKQKIGSSLVQTNDIDQLVEKAMKQENLKIEYLGEE